MVDTDIRGWQGCTVVDRDGDRIGKIQTIYTDERTGQPEWALVDTGLLGTTSTFVPLAQAQEAGGSVQVPYDKQHVKDAPRIEPDERVSPAEERELWRHYGLAYGAGAEAGDDPASGHDDAMTRSEEELRVGTQTRERGRVRLRKYVTTEQVQRTVPVQREKLRLEWEPAADANVDAAAGGEELAESEPEVVLHEDEPVVRKDVVPEERVRLAKETVAEEQQVGGKVRKEQVDLDDQDGHDRRP
jgi:uncharacterized protein (TIGR02271 family)